jgi:hypothetical protein
MATLNYSVHFVVFQLRGNVFTRLTAALGVWIALGTSIAVAQKKETAAPESLARIAAGRLKISESDVFTRAEELKRLHIERFDKFARQCDAWTVQLVRHLADHERLAAAAARGVAADGDKSLADTKTRMQGHAQEIRAISGIFDTLEQRYLVSHQLTANIIGGLRATPTDAPKLDVQRSRVEVDVDEYGIEASIPRLREWRSKLEDRSTEIEERLQTLNERLSTPQQYIDINSKTKGTAEAKALAKLLLDQVLCDVDCSEMELDEVVQHHWSGNVNQCLRDLRWRENAAEKEWLSQPDDPHRECAVIRTLRTNYENAGKIDAEDARDAALEEVKRQIRKRANELSTFESKIKTAEAVELEAVVYLMLREHRTEIVESRRSSEESPAEIAPKAKVDRSKASLTELVAITVPRIQEVSQFVRRCREVWLK